MIFHIPTYCCQDGLVRYKHQNWNESETATLCLLKVILTKQHWLVFHVYDIFGQKDWLEGIMTGTLINFVIYGGTF